jgi:RNA polymerase sigma factor (sigma-70 family)
MAIARSGAVPRRAHSGNAHHPTLADSELLDRFVAGGGEEAERAFAELVARHGPMVLGVCRRMLRDAHSADDAFQAAFLVLVRKAGSVRGETLAPWLHAVTYRVAIRARALATRLRERGDAEIDQMEAPVDEPDRVELRAVVDEEVHRLPEVYRAPVVLCYLAGHTQEEAARRLRCPVGTIKSRLSRARDLLKDRLSRRGIAVTAAVLSSTLAAEATRVAVPAKLAGSTVRAATLFAAGKPLAKLGVSAIAAGATEATLRPLIAPGFMLAGLAVLAAAVAIPGALGPRPAAPRGGSLAIRPGSAQTSAVAGEPTPVPGAPRAVDEQRAGIVTRIDAVPPEANAGETDPSARRDLGQDPEAQIWMALWYEAQGCDEERLKHLKLATLADPEHVTARGLLGHIAYRGEWRDAEEIGRIVRNDEKLATALNEYAARRDRTPDTAEGYAKLARWCDESCLRKQAFASYTAVTRLNSDDDDAWKWLGGQKIQGRWQTAAQAAAERADVESQAQADRDWRPRLQKWRAWLSDDSLRADAETLLAGVTDPRAVPSIWAVLVTDDAQSQLRAARVLRRINGRNASRALALLSVCGATDDVRRIAREAVLRRDPREFLGTLIRQLRDPIEYERRSVGGPLSPGVVFVDGRPFSARRLLNHESLAPPKGISPDGERGWKARTLLCLAGAMNHRSQSPLDHQIPDAPKLARTAQQQAVNDAKFIDNVNQLISHHNYLIVDVLSGFTSAPAEATHDDWAVWWAGEMTNGFDPAAPHAESGAANEPRGLSAEFFGENASLPTLPGLGAGTRVWTLTGIRPIETLRLGDCVLAQNTATGALDFEPILSVCHRPPSPTVRLQLDDDAIVVTAIHRFWTPGRGWVMARDVQAGDAVRARHGLVRVVAVKPAISQPVFNLEVAHASSFFAGRNGMLVHDVTAVEPTQHAFDARRAGSGLGD